MDEMIEHRLFPNRSGLIVFENILEAVRAERSECHCEKTHQGRDSNGHLLGHGKFTLLPCARSVGGSDICLPSPAAKPSTTGFPTSDRRARFDPPKTDGLACLSPLPR